MDIQASKKELKKLISEIEDSSVVDKFLNFVKSESILSDRQKNAIDQALNQVDRGETIPHNMVMDEMHLRYGKYFKK